MVAVNASDTRAAIEDVMALSPLQHGLYSLATFTDTEDDGVDPYVIAMSADVIGPLDTALLKSCAATMLVRHPNLRASFVHGDLSRPVQVVPTAVELPWRHLCAEAADVAALDAAERRRPFDLAHGPLIRFLLIETPQQHWHLLVLAHHIVIDGWSLPLFVGELITLYTAGGDLAALPPAPRPYRDYIGWLAGRDQDTSRARWRDHLAGLDAPTLLAPALGAAELPIAVPERTELRVDAERTARLVEAARRRGVTLNTLIQLAWANILSVCTDRTDVVFGVTVSGRPAELSGVESMVGLFINTVPLRVRLDPDISVGVQCAALQRTAADLREHGYLGHAELRRLAGIGELFDTLLVYENFPPAAVGNAEFRANGATFRPAALESLSHFPVTVAAHLTDGELVLLVEVLDGALGSMTPHGLGRRVLTVTEGLIDNWDRPLRDVGVLLPGEGTAAPVAVPPTAAGGVPTRLREVAATYPDAVALSWGEGRYTYREFASAVEAVAARLVGFGVGAETPVAIVLPRGPRYVVAMFAVLHAGAMIVPLDPSMPADRIADIVGQTGATVRIDDEFDWNGMQSGRCDPAAVHPDQAAYAVFTSGTTGKPKGVIGTHRAVLAYADDHARSVLRPAAARLGRPLRVAHGWSFTFDAAWQPLAALLHGHQVHLIGDAAQRDAEALVEIMAAQSLDMIDTTPSMFGQLDAAGLLSRVPLAVLALGGEAVSPALWRQIRAACERTGMTAHNCYGPTETTVEAVVAAFADHDQPSIGTPTGGTVAQVLDGWLRPVPDGVAGELYLSGAQLTRGYLGRAAETAGRFIADPAAAGTRMYRTGDVVRRVPGGGLAFLGRTDDQVKIRGFRVEPGEITAALLAHAGVLAAHVGVRRRAGAPVLAAYVVADATAAELRATLAARLPRYLVPQHIVVVDELPLTSHGKVDESALAAIEVADEPASAPATPTEAALAELLAQLLETDRVDVTADFLALGLDSIVALSLVQAARRHGIDFRARLMLDCTSIRELAAAIDSGVGTAAPAPAHPDRYGDVGPVPVVSWLREHGDYRRFTQNALITLPAGITADRLTAVLQALLDRHDMLRAVDTGSGLRTREPGAVRAAEVLHRVDTDPADALATEVVAALDRIDPTAGSMLQAVWFTGGEPMLLLCIHHLATDVVSWYVLLSELARIADELAAGGTPQLGAEYTTYRQWAQLLADRADGAELSAQGDYWKAQLAAPDPVLAARRADPCTDTWASLRLVDVATEVSTTRDILDRIDAAAIELRDFLLAALTVTLASWRRRRGQSADDGALIALEGHGREDGLLGSGVDTSATVGWFTSVFPVRLGAGAAVDVQTARRDPEAARALIKAVAEHVAAVPNRGLDYGLLRYLRVDPELVCAAHPQIEFNYVGRHDLGADPGAWSLNIDPALNGLLPVASEPDLPLRYSYDVVAVVHATAAGPRLLTSWRYSTALCTAAEADELAELWRTAVEVLGAAL